MDTKAKIKVIKKESQANFRQAKTRKAAPVNTKAGAREMVSTIAGWVNEFQQKRRDETKEAVKLLFDARHANNCANC